MKLLRYIRYRWLVFRYMRALDKELDKFANALKPMEEDNV